MSSSPRFPRLHVLWTFASPHRRGLALGLALGLVATATGLATPLVTKWVLDSIGSRSGLTGPVLGLVALLVVGTAVALTQWILLGTIAERVVLAARTSMVGRFLGATVPEVTRRPPGELVTRVTSDSVLLREAATSAGIGLVNAAIGLVGTLVLMAVLDLVLFGITVGLVLVVLALFATLMPAISRAETEAQAHLGDLGAELEGALRAIRTVKASRAERRQGDRIAARAADSARAGVRSVRATAVAWSVSWSGIQLAIIAVLAVGALRVDSGALPVSSLIAFLLYAFQLVGPLTELSQNLTSLQSGLAAAQRIREVEGMRLEESGPRPAAPGPGSAAPPAGPVLELRGVGARYGDGPYVLRGIDLAVPRRGHLAIVGPSGSGKTTLLSLLVRFLDPVEGEILLDGRPYRDLPVDAVRSRLSYVEQETPLVPGTVGDNLRFTSPDASPEEMAGALRAVQLDEVVGALEAGLDTPLAGQPLSGGQRQRLAVARSIVRLPDVLLLDEATAQVDGLTEAAVQRCIAAAATRGAVVTVAHRLSTVLDADEIVVLEAGRIRARGTHAELLAADELYRDLLQALRIAHLSAA